MGLGQIIQRRSHVTLGGVAGMLRNGWPESIGMPGRNGSEQVAGMRRNTHPLSLPQNYQGGKITIRQRNK